MDTNRIPKQALRYRPKGRRNIGRPKKRWRDQLHLEDQGTGNTPNPSGTWWWFCITVKATHKFVFYIRWLILLISLLEGNKYIPWRWPFKCWNMLEWRIVLSGDLVINEWMSLYLFHIFIQCFLFQFTASSLFFTVIW